MFEDNMKCSKSKKACIFCEENQTCEILIYILSHENHQTPCFECGKLLDHKDLDTHQISDNPEMFVELCKSCHSKVHSKKGGASRRRINELKRMGRVSQRSTSESVLKVY